MNTVTNNTPTPEIQNEAYALRKYIERTTEDALKLALKDSELPEHIAINALDDVSSNRLCAILERRVEVGHSADVAAVDAYAKEHVMSNTDFFGDSWDEMSSQEQSDFLENLDSEELVRALSNVYWQDSEEDTYEFLSEHFDLPETSIEKLGVFELLEKCFARRKGEALVQELLEQHWPEFLEDMGAEETESTKWYVITPTLEINEIDEDDERLTFYKHVGLAYDDLSSASLKLKELIVKTSEAA